MRAVSAVIRRYADAMASRDGVEWGSLDCIHFGCEGHHAAGWRDLRPHLPAYDSERAAIRALLSSGHGSLINALDAHATPIPAARAAVGDLAYLDQPPMGCIGLVIGAESLFLTAGGMLRKPTRELMIWRAE